MSSADSTSERAPTLGALFRLVHSAMIQEYARWLASSRHPGLQPAHAAVIQPLWQHPDGVRLTALARTARITKQSMGALVDALQAAGYVERIDDPDDRRAARIRLTARGRSYARDVRKFGHDLEAKLNVRLGERRMRELRASLELVLETLHTS